jgi:hypothetical protein
MQGCLDLKALVIVPIHYGTLRLSHEQVDEPLQLLDHEARADVVQDKVVVLEEGVTRFFCPESLHSPVLHTCSPHARCANVCRRAAQNSSQHFVLQKTAQPLWTISTRNGCTLSGNSSLGGIYGSKTYS